MKRNGKKKGKKYLANTQTKKKMDRQNPMTNGESHTKQTRTLTKTKEQKNKKSKKE